MLGEEAGEALVVVQAERLVGGDVDAGVFWPRFSPCFGSHDAGVVAEHGL